jgi:hypothetical protein
MNFLKNSSAEDDIGGSGAMWNMGQNEKPFYFCMKQVLKLVSCKSRADDIASMSAD